LVVLDDINSASGMVKCFERSSDKASHLLILQDDILPCVDFQETVSEIASLLPNQIISFFSAYDTSKPLVKKKHWLLMDRLYGTCAYVIPRNLAMEYLEFNKLIKDRIFADDVRISMFIKAKNMNVYVTAPSLVEHLCWSSTSQGEHKIGYNNINYRVAKNYIGYENSSLEIKWKKGLKNPEKIKIGDNLDFIRHYDQV
jgi:hypothetical protein